MTRAPKCAYCKDTGWGESDYDPGMFYPCHTCNPKGKGCPPPTITLQNIPRDPTTLGTPKLRRPR